MICFCGDGGFFYHLPELETARRRNIKTVTIVNNNHCLSQGLRNLNIAYEGRTFVLSACQYMMRADAPAAYDCIQGNDPATELIRGGSVIVGPLGDVLAGPVYGQEAVIAADIDLLDAIRGKYDLDVAGHYARPDIFHLCVDTSPRHPVSFAAPAEAAAGEAVD